VISAQASADLRGATTNAVAAASRGKPSVGIVVAAYNAQRYLAATLASIRLQTFANWECVVVDDGSTDQTSDVALAAAALDERIRVYRQPNAGPCVARNMGYSKLSESAEFVSFMDADDVWHERCLEILLGELSLNPSAVASHGLGEFIDVDGKPLLPGTFSSLGRKRQGSRGGKLRDWPLDQPSTFETVITSSVIFPPGLILTRRNVYDCVGLFDDAMRYAEDWDLLIRVARHGQLCFVDRVVLGYRRHESNVGTSALVPKACAAVRRKAYFSAENDAEQRQILRDMWRATQRDLIRDRLASAGRLLSCGHPIQAMAMALRLPFIGYRYLRGRPTKGGVR
jgi:glycosyltransferase involved in cell wall biosynthesis